MNTIQNFSTMITDLFHQNKETMSALAGTFTALALCFVIGIVIILVQRWKIKCMATLYEAHNENLREIAKQYEFLKEFNQLRADRYQKKSEELAIWYKNLTVKHEELMQCLIRNNKAMHTLLVEVTNLKRTQLDTLDMDHWIELISATMERPSVYNGSGLKPHDSVEDSLRSRVVEAENSLAWWKEHGTLKVDLRLEVAKKEVVMNHLQEIYNDVVEQNDPKSWVREKLSPLVSVSS